MRLKTLFRFKAKVIKPCSKLLSIFKIKSRTKPRLRTKVVRFRKPFSLKAFSFPRCRSKKKFRVRKSRASLSSEFKESPGRSKHAQSTKKPVQKVRIAELLTDLFSLRKTKDIDSESDNHVMGDVNVRSASPSEGRHTKEPFPSPITPGYVRISNDGMKESSDNLEEVEDACKNFENHLVEMIVEEGKLKDLMDVEELLYCWRNLKSPVFIDLVCNFYGELCKDMFSSSEENDSTRESSISSSE
ncbi:transcription repressor OFP17 [Amaranthus tricolor]|uniref:transcription repressor OFP17 n=1 Tax=Amaranthus tricolor TaxID=29722 RepID=UPI0025893321|nr:transcription repressor OFP17 [Amaranthus tricolor]